MASPMKVDNYAGVGDYGFDSIQMWCTSAITTAGTWVAILANDVTNPAGLEGFSVSPADSDNTGQDYDVVGVVMETTTAAGYVKIQTRGRYSTAVCAGATKGQNLVISATAGQAEAVGAETADTRIIGRALADSSGTSTDVWIYPHPLFS